ncbi:hypothetical protein J4429_00545 [Candidatus Pacearchaeota archaeon]|nr:hypothetical protein [uncultured archaeon]AQS33082.1 hypothetical protein [uncultured archaeon]MBS3074926.1 hypothetical protein [Candidatus Pacearchaeota archaeon]
MLLSYGFAGNIGNSEMSYFFDDSLSKKDILKITKTLTTINAFIGNLKKSKLK